VTVGSIFLCLQPLHRFHKVNISRWMKAENPGEIKGSRCLTRWAVAKLASRPATVNTEGPEEEPRPPFEELAENYSLLCCLCITLHVFSRYSNSLDLLAVY